MEFIKKTNVPVVLLCLVSIRMLFADASISLSLFGFAIASVYCYSAYLKSRESKPIDKHVKDELAEVKNMMTNFSVKNGIKPSDKNQRYF